MLTIERETPSGPVLEIFMQDPRPWIGCVGCGGEFLADGQQVKHDEITFDDGTKGYQPYCLKCYRKYIDPNS